MSLIRRIAVGLLAAALMLAMAACQPSATNERLSNSDNQTSSTVSSTPTTQPSGDLVWGRVPYCNCFTISSTSSATKKVAEALKAADLTANVKEQSPRDGWLYFVVSFDPDVVTWDEVRSAMKEGGAEVVDGPP